MSAAPARPTATDRTATEVGVYLVTDAAQAARQGRDVLETVVAAVSGGVRWVQLRAKELDDAALLDLLCAVGDAVPTDVRLVVNDRLPVVVAALEAGVRVDGVHLGQSDGPPAEARRLLGDAVGVGVSASTPDEIARAARDGADLVGIGAVRATGTKPDAPPPLGLAGAGALAAVARAHGLPSVAIGGLGAADLAELRRSGFAGAAVVSAVCAVADPAAAARSLVRAWEQAQ